MRRRLGDRRLRGDITVRYFKPGDFLVLDEPDDEGADCIAGRGHRGEVLVHVGLPDSGDGESVVDAEPGEELPGFGDFLFGGADGGVQGFPSTGHCAQALEVVPAGEPFDGDWMCGVPADSSAIVRRPPVGGPGPGAVTPNLGVPTKEWICRPVKPG